MKKFLLTIAMFVAMNTWSADYYVCIDTKLPDLESCIEEYLAVGYKPHGSLVVAGSKLLQPMFRDR